MFELVSLPVHLPRKIAIVFILVAGVGESEIVDHFAGVEDVSVYFLDD